MILLAALVLAASDPAPKPGAPMADPGADAGREVLVILDPDQAAAARGAIEAVARVTQSLPPRLLLVQADQPSWERVLRIPGVLAPAGPDDLPADLHPTRADVRRPPGRRAPRRRRGRARA